MSITPEQLRWVFVYMICLIASVAIHEFGHAWVANKLGDDTPRREGRVTLNPLAHADPVGTLAVPLIGALLGAATGRMGGFGWGRPVGWNPARVNRKWRMSTAIILVSVAGPAMNLLLGTILSFVHVLLVSQHVIEPAKAMSQIIYFAAGMNFTLFFFNLVPVPPLDGGHVAESFTPYKHRSKFQEYTRFSPFVFLALITIPQVQQIFRIPAMWCMDHVYHLFSSLLS